MSVLQKHYKKKPSNYNKPIYTLLNQPLLKKNNSQEYVGTHSNIKTQSKGATKDKVKSKNKRAKRLNLKEVKTNKSNQRINQESVKVNQEHKNHKTKEEQISYIRRKKARKKRRQREKIYRLYQDIKDTNIPTADELHQIEDTPIIDPIKKVRKSADKLDKSLLVASTAVNTISIGVAGIGETAFFIGKGIDKLEEKAEEVYKSKKKILDSKKIKNKINYDYRIKNYKNNIAVKIYKSHKKNISLLKNNRANTLEGNQDVLIASLEKNNNDTDINTALQNNYESNFNESSYIKLKQYEHRNKKKNKTIIYKLLKTTTKATYKGVLLSTRHGLESGAKVALQGATKETKDAIAPIRGAISATSSTLLRPKEIHKSTPKIVFNTVKTNVPDEIKELASPIDDTFGTAKSVGKASVKSAKTVKNTAKLAKRTFRGTVVVGKLAIKFANIVKMAKIATFATKVVIKGVIKAVTAILKVIKGIAMVVISVKAIIVAAIIAVIVAVVIIIISLIDSFTPNVETDLLLEYAALVRSLDTQVNHIIQTEINNADEVAFVQINYDDNTATSLHTNLHRFFALFMVKHEQSWQDMHREIEELHYLTYTLDISHEIFYEEAISTILDDYGNEIESIEMLQKVRVILSLVVFNLEEMFEILDFCQNNIEWTMEILQELNLLELFPELAPYLFGEGYFNLHPGEIIYIFDNIAITWPTHFRSISSPFGYRTNPITGEIQFHNGIDIPMPIGNPIFAATSGIVTNSFFSNSGGHMIVILAEEGIRTRYLHLDGRLVSVGQMVNVGDLIGLSGNTGHSTGPHLHFDISINGVFVDPLLVLP